MAFPQVATINSTGGSSVNTTTAHTVNMPTGIQSGDLLLLFSAFDGTPNVTGYPAGWTVLHHIQTGGAAATNDVAYKVASGSETSFNLGTSSTQSSAIIVARITGWDGVTAPAISTPSQATTSSPNPPAFNPSGWDVEDTLWITFVAWDDGTTSASSAPASYTNFTQAVRDTTSGGCGVAIATRENAVASEDPGTFTLSASEGIAAATVAVRPQSAQTLVMGLASLASAGRTGSVVPGSVSRQMAAAALVPTARSLSALVGGVSVSLDAASLESLARNLALAQGTTTISAQVAQLAALGDALLLEPGGVSVGLDSAALEALLEPALVTNVGGRLIVKVGIEISGLSAVGGDTLQRSGVGAEVRNLPPPFGTSIEISPPFTRLT